MDEPTRGHESFRLSPGLVMLALALKYFGLMAYGIHAAYVEVPSFVAVGGSLFAVTWAATVAVLAAFALGAVIRTWYTNCANVEKWATATLILGFSTYSVVLVVRGILLGNWDGIPLAWLPAVLAIFPAIRYYDIVSRETN